MRKYLLFILFLCLHYVARGQTARTYFWFDTNDEAKIQRALTTSATLDVSSLTDGYHVLHVQVDGGDNGLSAAHSRGFLKLSPEVKIDSMTCRFIIDKQLLSEERLSAKGGVMTCDLDVSSIPEGLHILFVEVVTPDGAVTSAAQEFFYRSPLNSEFATTKCYYSIDNSPMTYQADITEDGAYHFDVDVDSLSLGLHRIMFMLTNAKGHHTSSEQVFFTKVPAGGNGITRYDYWLNQDEDTYKTVSLEKRQNPFNLLTQLDVAIQPFCSQRYEFRIEKNQPVVYSQNDIHLRFFDDIGGMVDCASRYTDERVKENVTNLTPIVSEVTANMNRPEENKIKWFTLQGAWGDSLIFKADNECMMEVFSPSGKNVYSANGAASTTYGGRHITEDGTYYLAVHDVSDPDVSSLNIDFVRIDKDLIVLDEKATTLPTDTNNVFVKVLRTLKANEWSSIVLPFEMSGERFMAAFGSDAQLLEFTGYESMTNDQGKVNYIKVHFCTVDNNEGMKANHPYLIKLKKDVSQWLVDAANIRVDERPVLASVVRSEKEWSEFIGTYVANTVVPANCLYLNGNQFWYSSGSTKLTSAFQGYFDLHDLLADQSSGYNANIELCIDGGLNPADWAILKDAYTQLNGEKTWVKKWNLGNSASEVTTLPGVKIEGNRVVAIDISSNEVSGEFPYQLLKLEKLQSLNLSGNALTGDISTGMQNYQKKNGAFKTPVAILNISGNNLKGNLGEFAGYCPSLTQLDASYNQLSEVEPTIPSNVNLKMDHQTLETVDFNISKTVESLAALPSILYYNHTRQTYNDNIALDLTTDVWGMNLRSEGGNIAVNAVGSENVYRGKNGDKLTATLTNSNAAAEGTSFGMNFFFAMGDANFIDGVNAADLQATILFALNDYARRFNFTAANTHADEAINVLDVVSTVNLLLKSEVNLAKEVNHAKEVKSRRSLEKPSSTDASLFVCDGQLILQTSVPVATIDIKTSKKVDWNIERYGLTQTSNDYALVGYSLNGITLPVGETVLGTCSNDLAVLSVSAADAEANSISIAFTGGIATGIDHFAADDAEEMYSVTGIRTHQKEGMRLIRKNGKTVKRFYKTNK